VACNCSKKTIKEYVYTDAEGKSSTHETRLSASAAKIKAGNVGSIREVIKKQS
jgi:hypothetical protein